MGFWNRNKEPSFYERQKGKLQKEMDGMECCSAEYDAAMKELMDLQSFAGKEKEMNQFFDKQGRGNIVAKAVGGFSIIALTAATINAEAKGTMFLGSAGEFVKSAFRTVTNLLK